MDMKKKTITMTMEEWYEILSWCKTYYSEPETEQERDWEKKYWEAVDKLEKKLKK